MRLHALFLMLCCAFVGALPLTAQRSTSGTRFILPIPPAWAVHAPHGTDTTLRDIVIDIVATDSGRARLTAPMMGLDTTLTLVVDRTASVRIPAALRPALSGMITNRTVRVEATVPVFVSSHTAAGTAAVTHAPVTMWGTEYRTMHGDVDRSRAGRTYLVIAAGFHDTHVSMTPPVDYRGGPHVAPIPAGETGTVTLHEGQVLVLDNDYPAGAERTLTGTLLRSDKPITVMAGHGLPATESSADDSSAVQEGILISLPLVDGGTEFVVPSWTSGPRERPSTADSTVVHVMATNNGTVVSVQGPSTELIPYDTLAAGARATFVMNRMHRLVTSAPVQVVQHVPAGDEGVAQGATVVPPYERWTNHGVIVPISGARNTASAIMRTNDTIHFRVNGLPLWVWRARSGGDGDVARADLGAYTSYVVAIPDSGAFVLTMDHDATMMAWHGVHGSGGHGLRPAGYADLRQRRRDTLVVSSTGVPNQQGRAEASATTVDDAGRRTPADARTIVAENMTVTTMPQNDSMRIIASVDYGRYDGFAITRLVSGAGRYTHLVSLWQGLTIDADSTPWRFGITDIDDTVCADLVLTNRSSETMTITDIAVEGRPLVRLTTQPTPVVLAPGASLAMQGCVYSDQPAADADSVSATVVLRSASLRMASFTIATPFRQGTILCSSVMFDHGDAPGGMVTRTARIDNAGLVPVTIRGLDIRDTAGALGIVGVEPWPLVIPAGGSHAVDIELDPTRVVDGYDAGVVVLSTAGRGDSVIDVAIRPRSTSVTDAGTYGPATLVPNPVDRTGVVVLPCRQGAVYRFVATDGRTLLQDTAGVDHPSVAVDGLGSGVIAVMIDERGNRHTHTLIVR